MSIYNPRYRLRWGYEFKGGKTRRGMWSQPGNIPADQAWFYNKNITHAFIERKDEHFADIKLIVRCPSSEFMVFQWRYMAMVPSVFGVKKDTTPITVVTGLTMLTTGKAIDCYSDGKVEIGEARHLEQEFSVY
jgi:hypothetical protein